MLFESIPNSNPITFAIMQAIAYNSHMITSKQAADEIGCSPSTITRWAARLGFSQKFGKSIVLTKTQVKAIAKAWKRDVGNPNFGKQSRIPIAR
jgi:hypothetical protein